jgi:hypothetical protein
MRELVLQLGVSIDAYAATGDGAHDWGYDGEDPAMTGVEPASLRGRTVNPLRTLDSVLAPAPAS